MTHVHFRLTPGGAPARRYGELLRATKEDASLGEVRDTIVALRRRADPEVRHFLHSIFYNVVSEAARAIQRERFAELVAEHVLEQHWAELSFDVRFGSPGSEVPRYADEVNAGLIVVPSHGYGGVKRFLLGSVAERIIREAHCDVLVLRRQDAE